MSAPRPVHPRVCGEHALSIATAPTNGGSSPRVRGTLPRYEPTGERTRFIPACAGNTRGCNGHFVRESVHPRVCGEHEAIAEKTPGADGSSPRVRGTRVSIPCDFELRRFIPACAGNTQAWARSEFGETVHPRVCGEHSAVERYPRFMFGSSPRVRGTRVDTCRAVCFDRFIPACAGNTNTTHNHMR